MQARRRSREFEYPLLHGMGRFLTPSLLPLSDRRRSSALTNDTFNVVRTYESVEEKVVEQRFLPSRTSHRDGDHDGAGDCRSHAACEWSADAYSRESKVRRTRRHTTRAQYHVARNSECRIQSE